MTKNTIRRHRIQWLKALISGKYKQGRGGLKNRRTAYDKKSRTEYCCLGVTCNISKLGKWERSGRYTVNDYGSVTTLPWPVRKWVGMDAEEQSFAIEMNDTEQLSFTEIAKAFAKRWKIDLKRIA